MKTLSEVYTAYRGILEMSHQQRALFLEMREYMDTVEDRSIMLRVENMLKDLTETIFNPPIV